jgi:uncharacterized protein YndB with AHSA1/START domain/uncharacterized protein YciI
LLRISEDAKDQEITMTVSRYLVTGGFFAALLIALVPLSGSAEEMNAMYFFAKLMPPRQDFPTTMTAHEQEVMSNHFAYLTRLTMEKSVVLAGPCLDPVFGAIVLSAKSLEAATDILKNDPSVLAGVNTFEIQPMYLSLLQHNVPDFRYPQEQSGKALHKTVTVPTPVHQAWKDWTTSEGVRRFAPSLATIDLRIGGRYEWLFSDDAPEGQAGSEDCLILSYLPEKMLSFEWNAPPQLPEARRQRTVVVILFDEKVPGQTTVDFNHFGFGVGEEWDQTYDYFDKAWGTVLSLYAESVTKK